MAPAGTVVLRTPRRLAALSWRRLFAHSSFVAGAAIVAGVVAAAVFAPALAPFDPVEQAFTNQLLAPSRAHLFGTDEFGRDIFSRVIYGARIALVVGVVADGIAALLGVILGVISGYFGRRVDAVIMRTVDVLLAFPYLLLAMIVVAILGPSLTNAMIAIGIVYTPQFARVVRGAVLQVKEEYFVEAARAIGAGSVRLLARHVLPNILSPIIVMATLTVGFMIVETAGLSFLGLGASPPTPEWGSMLATGRGQAAPVDVTDPAQVAAFVTRVADAERRIDILVNTAGGVAGQTMKPVDQVPDADWRRIFAINLDGAFHFTRAVAPVMKAQKSGAIVNISSGAGRSYSLTGIQAYASAKAGLIGFTRQTAVELGPFGIRVNCLAPGFIRSNPATEKQWAAMGEAGQRQFVESIALRRLGTADEIARAVVFFACADASYVTGQTISVDGGKWMLG